MKIWIFLVLFLARATAATPPEIEALIAGARDLPPEFAADAPFGVEHRRRIPPARTDRPGILPGGPRPTATEAPLDPESRPGVAPLCQQSEPAGSGCSQPPASGGRCDVGGGARPGARSVPSHPG